MKILYFAWIREKVGTSGETVTPPETLASVRDLMAWLKERGGGYAEAFSDEAMVRVALNQEYVKMDHAISPGDEIAFFPPVTGG